MSTPWVAIPNQPCPECDEVAELDVGLVLDERNLDHQGRLKRAFFRCPRQHELDLPFGQAVSASGLVDLP